MSTNSNAVIFDGICFQGIDNNGKVVSMGTLWITECCTGRPAVTFTDSRKNAQNEFPIQLSASGKADVYLLDGEYDITLRDADGVEIWTITNFIPAGGDGTDLYPTILQPIREFFTGITGNTVDLTYGNISPVIIHKNGLLMPESEYVVDHTGTVTFVTALIPTDEIDVAYNAIQNGVDKHIQIVVPTCNDLQHIDTSNYISAFAKGRNEENDQCGGLFIFDQSRVGEDDGGIVFNGWVRVYSGEIDLKWYTGKTDGSSDVTALVQNAFNAGNSIYASENIYLVNNIEITGETGIRGEGAIFRSEVIDSLGGMTSNNIFTIHDSEMVNIENIILDGSYITGTPSDKPNVNTLLHIYNSSNISIRNVQVKNHVSNWDTSVSNDERANDKSIPFYSSVYIIGCTNVTISVALQENCRLEGFYLSEVTNLNVSGFESHTSPDIWTPLHVVASDIVSMSNLNITDGSDGDTGSIVNLISTHNFTVSGSVFDHKSGFDISNEITSTIPRYMRDTSYGSFDSCTFGGVYPIYSYPNHDKMEAIYFNNCVFQSYNNLYSASLRYFRDVHFDSCHMHGTVNFTDFDSISITNTIFDDHSISIHLGVSSNNNKRLSINVDKCLFMHSDQNCSALYIRDNTVNIKRVTFNNNYVRNSSFKPIYCYGTDDLIDRIHIIDNMFDSPTVETPNNSFIQSLGELVFKGNTMQNAGGIRPYSTSMKRIEITGNFIDSITTSNTYSLAEISVDSIDNIVISENMSGYGSHNIHFDSSASCSHSRIHSNNIEMVYSGGSSQKLLFEKVVPNILPTTDPAEAGQLWSDGGDVKVSAG